MNFTTTRLPYYSIFYVALIFSIAVAVLSWRNRKSKGVRAFTVSVLLEISWLAGYMFELSSKTLEQKIFWDNFQYVGALFAPIAFLVFSLQFTNRKFNLRQLIVPLIIISSVFQILIFSNLWPELIHPNASIELGVPFDEFTYDFGAITLLANAYAELIVLAYIIVLVSAFFKRNVSRTQLAIITIGISIPAVGVLAAIPLGWEFANQRDISPLMFALANILIAWGIFRMRLFNVAPIAREILFERMKNILIILDQADRVIDLNAAAQKALGNIDKEELIGTHISLLHPELYQEFGKTLEIETEISNEEGQTLSFSVSPLYNNRGLLIGRLVNANDITEQKKTSERLKKINFENELRARRLNAITDVSQAISQIRDLETLLPVITRQISDKFDFYHVGVFLFSKDGRFAELIAANSEGGKRMLDRGHRLEIGQVGVVGRVAQDGTPRVALDVGQDAVYFDNPDLPETHSEMALPLKVGLEIIGVLDVQSKRKNIFSDADTEAFIALANQVAIAIDNARQADATQTALEEAHALTQEYVRDSWKKLADTQKGQLGYRFANDSVFAYQGEEKKESVKSSQEMKIIEFPVKLREEVIGIIKVRMSEEEALKMTENDKALITAVGERAGLALESARFLDETQRKAQREAVISDISAKIGASIRMDNIIQTTVRELGKALEASEIAFQLIETKDGDE